MNKRVFISYKREEQPDEKLAEFLYKELTEAGVDAFYDRRTLPATHWQEQIREKIQRCNLFICILSTNSIESANVRDELKIAKNPGMAGEGVPGILPIAIVGQAIGTEWYATELAHIQRFDWNSAWDNGKLLRLIKKNLGYPKLWSPETFCAHERSVAQAAKRELTPSTNGTSTISSTVGNLTRSQIKRRSSRMIGIALLLAVTLASYALFVKYKLTDFRLPADSSIHQSAVTIPRPCGDVNDRRRELLGLCESN